MAFRRLEELPKQAMPGQILLVIHDFEARSPDELSLIKGDKIELIERDDDFGDGWYLGKHLQDGRTGLFPEVYTMKAPRPTYSLPTKPGTDNVSPTLTYPETPLSMTSSNPRGDENGTSSTASKGNMSEHSESSNEYTAPARATPSPLNTASQYQRSASLPSPTYSTQATNAPISAQRSISMMMGNNRNHGEDSPVMNETLSVIDEHITDLNTPRSSLFAPDRRGTNDSGSEYSSHIDHRMSYINGNETDEEERVAHNEHEVLTWGPAQVAQHLKEIGVENRHCEVFKEQEISGEVLLSMDQASIFMKEFDLGLVGRRLRTWHKIKAFQDEVKAYNTPHVQNTSSFGGGDAGSDDLERSSSQPSTSSSMLPRIPSLIDHTGPKLNTRSLRQGSPRVLPHPHSTGMELYSVNTTPPFQSLDSPRHSPRPSAASIRDFNHSRRHSSADFTPKSPSSNFLYVEDVDSPNRTPSPHKKHPSFDRNWTMSGAIASSTGRATSALGIGALAISGHALPLSTDRNTFNPSIQDLGIALAGSQDVDRGYISGNEIDSKKSRNVLRKKDAASVGHSRQNSYNQDTGNTLGVPRRHSRFGSADSIRETLASVTSPASKIYHGNSLKGRFRSISVRESSATIGMNSNSTKEIVSPVVTKLDYGDSPGTSISMPSPKPDNDSPSSKQGTFSHSAKPRVGVRTISEAVTEGEKALVASPSSITSPVKESPFQSPTRTGSETTSGASKSFELESTDASSKDTSTTPMTTSASTNAKRVKNKKETSAYTRGLEKKPPKEQMIDCDYSGWMKKKSPSLMTTWKPRLFILRGRRLSYYYTENDKEEKGLIDISSHRVLPADGDRITGLHATVTGAKTSPTSPANTRTPTLNETEAAAQAESSLHKPSPDGIFIFKLVPPRTGLSRAVNFTKPTVHYFAVDNIQQGRLWMAALMKATIDRDETSPLKTTYNQKTISLAKARAMRQRPPALMGADEELARKAEIEADQLTAKSDQTGLNIQGLNLGYEYIASGMSKETPENGDSSSEQPATAPLHSAFAHIADVSERSTDTTGLGSTLSDGLPPNSHSGEDVQVESTLNGGINTIQEPFKTPKDVGGESLLRSPQEEAEELVTGQG